MIQELAKQIKQENDHFITTIREFNKVLKNKNIHPETLKMIKANLTYNAENYIKNIERIKK